jgi:ribonuclease BN (tRNA processing enzyme)
MTWLSNTVLGSGTSVPSRRLAPAHLVRAPDAALLVDCGSGCTTSLFRAGVTLDRIDGVFLTHLHPDHTADLVPLLFALVNPVHPARTADLPIRGPEGVAAHLEALRAAYGRWVRPSTCEVRAEELAHHQRVDLGGLACTAFSVTHAGKPSFAYRFERGGRVLCLSGDSGPCDGLLEAARGAHLFICECAALDGEELAGHMSPTQVGRLAREAGCRRVVLTHLYDHVERAGPVALVRAVFDGEVELARDGQEYAVGSWPSSSSSGIR